MGFTMGFTKEELKGKPPVPPGWYDLRVKGFKPKAAGKEKDSVSLNCEMEIVNHPEYDGRRVWAGLNSKAGWIMVDFVHATGNPMEVIQNEFAGTERETFTIPGVFEGSDTHPDDPSQWKYLGPLQNATLQVEVAIVPGYQGGQDKNEVRQYKCAVPGCKEKHSTNLLK